VLAGAGFRQTAHVTVEQTFADNPAQFLDRARSRSLSMLAALPETQFAAGLRTVEQDVREGRIPQRVVEHVPLVEYQF
jgi:hypothetical protein